MEELLHQAERSEKEYEWLKGAESYEKALKLLPEVYEIIIVGG